MYHHASIRIRVKSGEWRASKYLYLRYRDGDKVKDLYLGKMAI